MENINVYIIYSVSTLLILNVI